MKSLFLLLLLIPMGLLAQQEKYSRVCVELNKEQNLASLAKLGLCVDHGIHQKNKLFVTELSKSEIDFLDDRNYKYEVLIDNVVENLHQNRVAAVSHCEEQVNGTEYIVPDNFEFGSLSGYYSYQEMLNQLDSMRALYPNLITVKDSLPEVDGVSTSHEGRPLWMVKVSNNADVDENEPEMIYTAIHHAREPGSLTQTIFYLWYLLENYGTDDHVTSILNNTELYFVPMLNPDGYVFNETTNPSGGGFWRKNRRDNGDGTFGVDLNRNYPYEWAYDNVGSSPDPSSDTYRGPSAGSEPEIKLIMNFVDNHDFKFALNYHTYGGLLIYPWGFSDSFTPDSLEYIAFGEHMVSENGYTKGTGSETVGYTVNGDSDDWYYGDTTGHDRIYSMTPEAGNSFWPAQNEIIPFCNDNLYPNLWMASYLLNYARLDFEYEHEISTLNPIDLDLNLKRLGLQDSMDFIVGFQNFSATQITSTTSPLNFSNFDHLDDSTFNVNIEFNSSGINNGDTINLELYVDNGDYKEAYPIYFIYDNPLNGSTAYSNDLSTMGLWTGTGNWGLDQTVFSSPSTSIGDSPNNNYNNMTVSQITLDTVFDLSSISEAFVKMKVNFDIEDNFDYVQFVAHSMDDNQDYPLCGLFTENGSSNQLEDEPVYDGDSKGWVSEKVSLEDLYGHKIKLRFDFESDAFEGGRGFNFDDFEVVIKDAPLGLTELNSNISISPNPFQNTIEINGIEENTNYKIYDLAGKFILDDKIETDRIDLSTLNSGVYFIHVNNEIKKIVKL